MGHVSLSSHEEREYDSLCAIYIYIYIW